MAVLAEESPARVWAQGCCLQVADDQGTFPAFRLLSRWHWLREWGRPSRIAMASNAPQVLRHSCLRESCEKEGKQRRKRHERSIKAGTQIPNDSKRRYIHKASEMTYERPGVKKWGATSVSWYSLDKEVAASVLMGKIAHYCFMRAIYYYYF